MVRNDRMKNIAGVEVAVFVLWTALSFVSARALDIRVSCQQRGTCALPNVLAR